MPRIELQVPFAEKEEAKRLGARWDVKLQRWYVPDGLDHALFEKWLAAPQPPNIRAPFWYLVTSTRACWRCEAVSRVFAILLPPGHEVLNVADDPFDDCWTEGEDSTLLSYVDDVPEGVAAQLRQRAPRYHVDYSQTIDSFYWMNHCELCAAKLGDFETIEEFGAFEHLVDRVQIDEPFSASCGGCTQ